jgi:hypothetical protein
MMPCEAACWSNVARVLGSSRGLIPLIPVFWGPMLSYLLAEQHRQDRWREEDRQLREARRRSWD